LLLSAQSSSFEGRVRIRQPVLSPPATQAPAPQVSQNAAPTSLDLGDGPQGKLLLMYLIAESMLGKKINLLHIPGSRSAAAVTPPNHGQGSASIARARTTQVEIDGQQTRFRAQGQVDTADGRHIQFTASLSLSREFVGVSASEGTPNAQDPLVLNFDGKGVQLKSGQTTPFDLNGDGQTEPIPVLAPGSGILFDDKNGDGIANNGTELFGPQSGDGFADLAQLDTDSNGWIDSGDPVFGELRVWFQSGAGPGKSYTLSDLGVGAISVANVATPFDLRTPGNALLGQIRSTGIYLREDGEAGTVSHVDLSV
jgi:hypothetical protein